MKKNYLIVHILRAGRTTAVAPCVQNYSQALPVLSWVRFSFILRESRTEVVAAVRVTCVRAVCVKPLTSAVLYGRCHGTHWTGSQSSIAPQRTRCRYRKTRCRKAPDEMFRAFPLLGADARLVAEKNSSCLLWRYIALSSTARTIGPEGGRVSCHLVPKIFPG